MEVAPPVQSQNLFWVFAENIFSFCAIALTLRLCSANASIISPMFRDRNLNISSKLGDDSIQPLTYRHMCFSCNELQELQRRCSVAPSRGTGLTLVWSRTGRTSYRWPAAASDHPGTCSGWWRGHFEKAWARPSPSRIPTRGAPTPLSCWCRTGLASFQTRWGHWVDEGAKPVKVAGIRVTFTRWMFQL